MQASFANAKLHNADWTRALIGEYPSLKHKSPVLAVAVHGAITVTGCLDGKVLIWKDDQVPSVRASLFTMMVEILIGWLCWVAGAQDARGAHSQCVGCGDID